MSVAAGSIGRLEIALHLGSNKMAAKLETVVLDEFVVAASKEMTGAAIAVNTQRYAPNTMNVVSTELFYYVLK